MSMLMVKLSYMDIDFTKIQVIFQPRNLLVHHLLEMQITLPGEQIQMTIQAALFILTAMVSTRILSLQLMVLQLILIRMTMTMISICTLVRKPPNLMTLLASAIIQTLRPKTTVTGTTPNWMHNPLLG